MKYLALILIVLVTGCSTPRMVTDAQLSTSTARELCWRWLKETPRWSAAVMAELHARGEISEADYVTWQHTPTHYASPASFPSCFTLWDLNALGGTRITRAGTSTWSTTVSTSRHYSTITVTPGGVSIQSHEQ